MAFTNLLLNINRIFVTMAQLMFSLEPFTQILGQQEFDFLLL